MREQSSGDGHPGRYGLDAAPFVEVGKTTIDIRGEAEYFASQRKMEDHSVRLV